MNADELMTGDIVRVAKDVSLQKGTIVSIKGVDADNCFKEKHLVGSATCLPLNDKYKMTCGVWVEYLEPIPLTPEILEKNGFKRNNRQTYIYKDNYCEVCVSIVPKIKIDNIDFEELPINVSIKGALFDINMIMSAIHELQHGLRLCRINKNIEL